MNLLRTSALNGVSVLIRLGTTLFINKVLATFVGTAGYGVVGQFQSLVSIVTSLASGAGNNGVIKFTAEYAGDEERQYLVWRTATMLSLAGAAVGALALLLLREPIAARFLGGQPYVTPIVWLAALLVFVVLNGLLLAMLNGRQAITAFVIANIAGSLVSATVAALLVSRWRLEGALLAVALNQAVAFAFTALIARRALALRWRRLLGHIDGPTALRLSQFALMTLVSAAALPTAQVVIRDVLARHLGWHDAGLWQAMAKISETHLLLLVSTLSVYFLPKFAALRDAQSLQQEVRRGYSFVLVLVAVSASLIFLLREPLIVTLLTPEFLPIADVLGWQLLGDVLKIGSWVTAYTMVSHARTKTFVATEIGFAVLLAGLTSAFATRWGLAGAAWGYALTYGLYWVVTHTAFRVLTRELAHAGIIAPARQLSSAS